MISIKEYAVEVGATKRNVLLTRAPVSHTLSFRSNFRAMVHTINPMEEGVARELKPSLCRS